MRLAQATCKGRTNCNLRTPLPQRAYRQRIIAIRKLFDSAATFDVAEKASWLQLCSAHLPC